MSYYSDDRSRRRSTVRDRRDSEYYDDTTVYNNSRDNARSTAVVKRRDDSVDSVEEVRRDFSPGGGGYYRETTIRKSGTRPAGSGRARSYEDDRYFEEDRYSSRRGDSYQSRRSRDYDDRQSDYTRDSRRHRRDDYSDESSRSRSPPKRERRKSVPEQALEAIGLGGVGAALLGKKKDRSSSRERGGRSRSRGGTEGGRSKSHGREQLTQAVKAAVLSGAVEAFRARKEPGGWGGDKGKRVLTAAFAAGGVDGLINLHGDPEHHKLRDTIGSAIAGVATSRIVNGPRSKSRGRGMSPDARSGRSRSRSKVGDFAAGGALGAAATKIMSSIRGQSQGPERGRARSRSRSYDSYDSRSPPRQSMRSRSRSVVARGLAAVGLNNQADKVDPTRRASSRPRRYSDEYSDGGYSDNVSRSRSVGANSMGRSRSIGPGGVPRDGNQTAMVGPVPPGGYRLDYGPHHNGDPDTDSDSDLGSSSEEEKEHKKENHRLLITGGLATIATIHAGHSIYQSVEKRKARKHAVRDGKITKEEAERNKTRDRLQEAASVGLAALGIKGAYSEWKETKEVREEMKEKKETLERHARKRAARRRKARAIKDGAPYTTGGYANSAPDLTNEPDGGYYNGGRDPYQPQQMNGYDNAMMHGAAQAGPHYSDGNPYAYMAQEESGHYPTAPNGQAYQNPFPPPPMGPPPQTYT